VVNKLVDNIDNGGGKCILKTVYLTFKEKEGRKGGKEEDSHRRYSCNK